MSDDKQQPVGTEISPGQLIELLNEDLSREYQALMICTVYSQMISGAAAYRNIARGLEQHAQEELQHALVLGDQIHALGGIPEIRPKLVKTSDNTEQMLRFELENGNETIRNYRERVGQCEALGEHAMAAQICEILAYEQQHHVELATALGEPVPDITVL